MNSPQHHQLYNDTLGSDVNNGKQDSSQENGSSVQVAVRVRPFLPSEAGNNRCVDVMSSNSLKRMSVNNENRIKNDMIRIGGENGPTFTFDVTFEPNSSQRLVFGCAILPLVKACLDGYNATILAYGQTGSGKTFTILGPSSAASIEGETDQNDGESLENTSQISNTNSQAGVIPRALRELFHRLESLKASYCTSDSNDNDCADSDGGSSRDQSKDELPHPYEYEVRVQFLELYGEEIRDLLSSSPLNKLSIRDGGPGLEPEVIGASEVKVTSAEEALLCLTRGMLRRVTGATAMNAESSRSHAIMTVVVEQTTVIGSQSGIGEDGNTDSNGNIHAEVESKRSKLHFVDLAGSERQKRSQAEGKRLKEGIDINKGLLVLGNVISALGDPKKRGKTFVPYRDSKLTRLLKGSLGGNHKTLMIACVSPSSSNMEESLNCLRYANRAKNIQNNAVVNVDAGSRLVAELRVQVQALAAELLQEIPKEEEKTTGGMFTREALQSLLNGGDSSGQKAPYATSKYQESGHGTAQTPIRTLSGQTLNQASDNLHEKDLEWEKRLDDAHNEIELLRKRLKNSKDDLFVKSEELLSTKAEVEYYRLQDPGGNYAEDEQPHGSNDNSQKSKSAFIERVSEYEREIAWLKDELRNAKAVSSSSISNVDDDHHGNFALSPLSFDGADYQDDDTAIVKATEVLEEEKHNLAAALQKVKGMENKNKEIRRPSSSHEEVLDKEVAAEQKELDHITNKYLKLSDDPELNAENDDINCNGAEVNPSSSFEEDHNEAFLCRQEQLDAHLLELSKSIAAKEELIEHLRSSQDKYETMRAFYEDKLSQMESQLKEREKERQNLVDELRKYEKDSQNFKDLQWALTEKEKHIANLRKRHKELASLTKVSSRNDKIMSRLKSDIVSMKCQKVDLQRQMAKERKMHSAALKELKRDALLKGREAAKTKQELAKSLAEKEKVQRVAKSHAEEVNKLRTKYRDAEKRLRMQTLKRGVMEKAGIDSLMVGRREIRNHSENVSDNCSATSRDRRSIRSNVSADFDTDQLRIFLDEKVAEIGRKEAAADKLAHEWEDHLDLMTRKDDLLKRPDEGSKENINDELEALDIQIQYKEGRIRQLSRRLGDRPKSMRKKGKSYNSLLEAPEFEQLCASLPPVAAAQLTSKVLFGMVVRERRRVTALARTASALDQKVVDAQSLAASKEAAIRSHMEEVSHQRAAMAQTQQEKILSLMALVQEEQEGATNSVSLSGDTSKNENKNNSDLPLSARPHSSDSMVLRLANERIDVLELQLSELQGEKEAKEVYKARETQLSSELSQKNQEFIVLQRELKRFKSALRQIRESLSTNYLGFGLPPLPAKRRGNKSNGKPDEPQLDEENSHSPEHINSNRVLLSIIQETLHPSAQSKHKKHSEKMHISPEKRIRIDTPPVKSPGIKSHIAMMHSSDSEDGEDLPEWAGDIMEDLEIIAAGNVPPSLKSTNKKTNRNVTPYKETRKTISQGTPKGDVFERLTDPSNFTGVQKNSFLSSIDRFPDHISEASGTSRRSASSRKSRSKSTLKHRETPRRSSDEYKSPGRPFSTGRPLTARNSKMRHVMENLPPSVVALPETPNSSSIKGSNSSIGSLERFDNSSTDILKTAQKRSIFRTVFDRLQSPSNYTGTQRRAHSNLRGGKNDYGSNFQDVSSIDEIGPTENSFKDTSDMSKTPYATFVQEYTQQDVFERLQKKVTNSYAMKQQTGLDADGDTGDAVSSKK